MSDIPTNPIDGVEDIDTDNTENMADVVLDESRIDPLASEREKHRLRAARFGMDFVEPHKTTYLAETQTKSGMVSTFDPLAPEEEAKRLQRSQRFGLDAQETTESDAPMTTEEVRMERAKPPRIPNEYTVQRKKLSVYGTDILTTRDLIDYFRAFNSARIEWINDICCNAVFKTEEAAAHALKELSLPNLETNEIETDELVWRDAKSFRGVPLKLRMAVNTDVKSEILLDSKKLYLNPDERKKNMKPQDRRRSGERSSSSSSSSSAPYVPALDRALGFKDGKIEKDRRNRNNNNNRNKAIRRRN